VHDVEHALGQPGLGGPRRRRLKLTLRPGIRPPATALSAQ
jgi:hypothetical protein